MALKKIDAMFSDCESWTNKQGNKVRQVNFGGGDRYKFDAGLVGHGWQQYDTDQDAWYFGVWVCTELRQVLTYAEGDSSLVECSDGAHFKLELESMAKYYGSPPPAFTVIHEDGKITDYYDDKALFGRTVE